MNILILSSASLHFPLDTQDCLKVAGLNSHRLASLNSFIASPLRNEPFLAILEIGSTEDIDRALVAYEWAETVQPLAAARYLLLVGSKHISLQEKANRFRGVEIAQLPLPTKNLLFKLELQLKVLSKESNSKIQRKLDGFTAEIRQADKERVMVVRGMGPKEGGWKNSGDAPQGRTRWRWIDDPPKKGKPQEKFSWSAESKIAPVFNPDIDAWEVNDPEADLQCHRDGQEMFSAKKAFAGTADNSEPSPLPQTLKGAEAPASPATRDVKKSAAAILARPAAAGAQNNIARASDNSPASTSPPAPFSEPKAASAATFSGEKHSGANPLRGAESSELAQTKNTSKSQSTEAAVASASNTQPEPGAAGAPPAAHSRRTAGGPELPPIIQHRSNPASPPATPEEKEKKPAATAANSPASAEAKKAPAPSVAALRESSPAREKEPSAGPAARPAKAAGAEEGIPSQAAPESQAKTQAAPRAPAQASGGEPASAASPISSKPATSESGRPTASLVAKHSQNRNAVVEPENSAPSAERNPSAADMANKEMVQKPETFNTDQLRYSAPRAELNRTSQEHPVENREMKGVELTDRSREIIDKISIPSGMAPSEPQNLLRAGGELKPTDLNLVTGEARAKEDRQHLKARHFLTLSLEDLNDQNSTWLPVEGYRIYLSAQHRYRGLREVTDIFPLWIYEGELPPEFLDQKKAWKFYDRLPKSYTSLEATPAPVAKYILEMKGAQAEEVKTTAAKPEGKAVAPEANTEAKYLAGSERDGQIASPTPSAPTHSALERIFSAIKAMLGISG